MWGTPTLRLFLMAWVGSLALWGGLWMRWADAPAIHAEQGALAALGLAMLLAPWLAGPGLLPLLRRRDSGGVNLPHAEYWFSGERRSSSLDRLRPYLEVMGTLLSVFLSMTAGVFVAERTDAAFNEVSAVAFLASVLMLLGGLVIWTRSVMRAFPPPDAATRGASALRPSRRGPRRPAHRRTGSPGRPSRPSSEGD